MHLGNLDKLRAWLNEKGQSQQEQRNHISKLVSGINVTINGNDKVLRISSDANFTIDKIISHNYIVRPNDGTYDVTRDNESYYYYFTYVRDPHEIAQSIVDGLHLPDPDNLKEHITNWSTLHTRLILNTWSIPFYPNYNGNGNLVNKIRDDIIPNISEILPKIFTFWKKNTRTELTYEINLNDNNIIISLGYTNHKEY